MTNKTYTIMFPSKEIFEGYKALIERNVPGVQVVRFPEALQEYNTDNELPNDEWFIAPREF